MTATAVRAEAERETPYDRRAMRSFVIQDEGLHHCTRTPGFSFA